MLQLQVFPKQNIPSAQKCFKIPKEFTTVQGQVIQSRNKQFYTLIIF